MSKRTANNPVFLWEDSGRPRPRRGFIHCLDLLAVVIFGQHHVLLGLAGRREIGGRRERGGELLGQGLVGRKTSSALGGGSGVPHSPCGVWVGLLPAPQPC